MGHLHLSDPTSSVITIMHAHLSNLLLCFSLATSHRIALAAVTAVDSGFPFIRKLCADDMIGMGEMSKCAYISKVGILHHLPQYMSVEAYFRMLFTAPSLTCCNIYQFSATL